MFERPQNNEIVPMTRRFPKLPKKVLHRDSEISKKLIKAWDVEKDPDKVLSIFLKEMRNLSDERYWECLRTVWIVAGKISTVPTFLKLFKSSRKERYYFSTPEEAEQLRNMPEPITVYRAGSENDGGISWTISLKYAQWYKQEYKKETILTRQITKKQVFAFINRNLEYEIILL